MKPDILELALILLNMLHISNSIGISSHCYRTELIEKDTVKIHDILFKKIAKKKKNGPT